MEKPPPPKFVPWEPDMWISDNGFALDPAFASPLIGFVVRLTNLVIDDMMDARPT